MKRSYSFNDVDVRTNISENCDADKELVSDAEHSNFADAESKERMEKTQLTNGKMKVSTSVLDIVESNSRMEQMEMENYALRKRCKRLEHIVTQLLESKGKDEPHDYEIDDLDERKVRRYSNRLNMLARSYKESPFIKISPSPPYYTTDSPLHSKTSPSRDWDSSTTDLNMISNPSMIATPVSTFPEDFFKNTSSKIEIDPGMSDANKLDDLHDITVSHPRHIPQTKSISPIQSYDEKLKTGNAADKISPKEMEQQNEIFRATYYAKQNKRQSSSKDDDNFTISSMKNEKHYPSRYTDGKSYERCCYEPRSKSPEMLASSYYSRYRGYDQIKFDCDQKSTDSKHCIPSIAEPSQSEKSKTACKPLTYQKVGATHVLYPSQGNKALISDSIRTTPHHTSLLHRKSEIKTYSPVRTLSSGISPDPDLDKYNSDFYTKLPPKLHIVESQNENGITLTWNTTSNCDSSLVKSYQLFARELFGHKIGTMKRIGIVDALPLPMSCNIDKLKYNIKYKFAVCAVDVYGRFGKMSNFTGKFELKPKGPITEVDEKDTDLEII